ncbi:DUF721 domain-containing protein [Synechococcus sp. Nb3U1]|uniref:DUF721 domain-containing protein n=1 Tax=Synechococcus sp. Nb3U1 TaxID=1914529 RepID=UPI001F439C81|nr:DUF721 domain-containing protein [Synechococcus sp. Nb3U1]MCF2970483.1 DUF721 domain-containing protein [Synechococcus sp. Nb3U1]
MLRGLEQTLRSFGSHPLWAELKQMQTLRQLWPEVVGEVVAAQTYPLSVRRQVLQVATSNPAWAQNLAFQRHLILKKLNSHLHTPLISDIRFSPGAWHEGSGPTPHLHPDAELTGKFYGVSRLAKQDRQPLPSRSKSSEQQPPLDAKTAFERWVRVVKQQQTQQNMFPCPTCHCPTPAAELERWFVCGFCHRQSVRPQR